MIEARYILKVIMVVMMAPVLFWQCAGDKQSSRVSKDEQAESRSNSSGDTTASDISNSQGSKSVRTVTYRFLSEAEFKKLAGKQWSLQKLQEEPVPQKKELLISIPGTNKKRKASCYTIDGLTLCDTADYTHYYFFGYWLNPNTKQRYVIFNNSSDPPPDYPNLFPSQTYLMYYRDKEVVSMQVGGGTHIHGSFEGIFVSPDQRYMIFLGKTDLAPSSSHLDLRCHSIVSDPIQMLWSVGDPKPKSKEESGGSPFEINGDMVGRVGFWSSVSSTSALIMEMESSIGGERRYVLFEWD